MRSRPRSFLTASLIVIALALVAPAATFAASTSVECGQLTTYTSPDPLGPTDGSLKLGNDTWTVLATATVSPAAEAALPGLVNSSPTCVSLDLDDDGNITAIDFAPTGTISGTVDFDSGSGFYLFANRLIIPDSITTAEPALGALFVTSYQAGTTLTVTFTVDPATGGFTGFDGMAAFCGKGSVTSGGDGKVGKAIIPAAVLDADDLAALAGAGSRKTCATVHSTGTIDSGTGNISTATDVTIKVAAAGATVTPPPTDAVEANDAPDSQGSPISIAVALGLLVGALWTGRVWSRRHSRQTR